MNPRSILISLLLATPALAQYKIDDRTEDKQLDVTRAGKLVGTYMYDYDNSSGSRREDTFKTFLQVYDPTGKLPLTKALGGEHNHHRGIFMGGTVTVDGESFDVWHGHGGAQIHQDFKDIKSGENSASFTSRMLWEKGKNGAPVLEENRTMTFHPAPDPAYAMIDVNTRLRPLDGKTVTLEGDQEHSGLQFRVASGLDLTKTLYLYPKKDAHPHHDLDYPWLACSFVLDGRTFTAVYLSHNENPPGWKFSAYRDYARFGAFFKSTIEKDDELNIRVRFLLLESEIPPAKWIQEQYNAYTGLKNSVPETTQKGPH